MVTPSGFKSRCPHQKEMVFQTISFFCLWGLELFASQTKRRCLLPRTSSRLTRRFPSKLVAPLLRSLCLLQVPVSAPKRDGFSNHLFYETNKKTHYLVGFGGSYRARLSASGYACIKERACSMTWGIGHRRCATWLQFESMSDNKKPTV